MSKSSLNKKEKSFVTSVIFILFYSWHFWPEMDINKVNLECQITYLTNPKI